MNTDSEDKTRIPRITANPKNSRVLAKFASKAFPIRVDACPSVARTDWFGLESGSRQHRAVESGRVPGRRRVRDDEKTVNVRRVRRDGRPGSRSEIGRGLDEITLARRSGALQLNRAAADFPNGKDSLRQTHTR